MKKTLLKIILLSLPVAGIAQETLITVSRKAFDESGEHLIGQSDGWVFKSGNDIHWKEENIDSQGWEKLKPVDLSSKYADKNGRVEGWFRARVKIDSNAVGMIKGINSIVFAASEVFLNGTRVAAFGRTGSDDGDFMEYAPLRKLGPSVHFQPGKIYTVAIHVVDHVQPLPFGRRLRSEYTNLKYLFFLTDNTYDEKELLAWADDTLYDGMLTAVTMVLSLLFWILYYLNRFEKNTQRFAIGCGLLGTLSLSVALSTLPNNSYNQSIIFFITGNLSVTFLLCYIPFILAGVFGRSVHRITKITLIVVLFVIGFSVNSAWYTPYLLALFIIPLTISLYYLVSSIKRINGAQWAIAIGFLFSFLFLMVYIIASAVHAGYIMLYVVIYTFSPPLGMLVYVSIRFKKMIEEVRENAAKVLRLSDEKREQALHQQKILEEEVAMQTSELRTSLVNLKATQTQLIQKEKMASLGELTAGIAHEIQNPLNFVNNFSEVSIELLQELKEEEEAGHKDDVITIADDLAQNLEKINHHGKRADAIVKGMLQHSQSGSGAKEPTSVNALAEEVMRLAYYGLRAKDKSFNAELITNFDTTLPDVNIIPQDISRVILNIFNNAFYAVNQKSKTAGDVYKPEVTVSTSTANSQVVIKVKDNGIGIPDAIKDKIMQPFFTTKPTGEGTGLGLSLSYDIVVKGHGGSIGINTKEGEFTEFTVHLPI